MASYFQSPSWVGNFINYGTQKMVAEYNAEIAEADRLSNEAINTARNQSNENIAKSNREMNKEIAELNANNALEIAKLNKSSAIEVAGINAAGRWVNSLIPFMVTGDSGNNNMNNTHNTSGGSVSSAAKAEQAFDSLFPTLKDTQNKKVINDTFDSVKSTKFYNQLAPLLTTEGLATVSSILGVMLTAI